MGDYITITDITSYVGGTFNSSTIPTVDQMNDFISLAEDEFTSEVADYTLTDNVDELCDGHFFGIKVSNLPVNSVGTIDLDRGNKFSRDWNSIVIESSKSLSDYMVIDEPSFGKIDLWNPVKGIKNYRVSYNSGYAQTSMPSLIKHCVLTMTLRHVFKNNFFSSEGSGDVQEVVDVDVYRRITGGGSPYQGLSDIDSVINDAKGKILRKYKTYVV